MTHISLKVNYEKFTCINLTTLYYPKVPLVLVIKFPSLR